MNVQQPDGLQLFPKAKNPLTSALAGVFTVPSDQPGKLKMLLERMEQSPRR